MKKAEVIDYMTDQILKEKIIEVKSNIDTKFKGKLN